MATVRENELHDLEDRDDSEETEQVKVECLPEEPSSSDASEPSSRHVALYNLKQEEHTEKTFQCDVCSQTMPSYEALMEHRNGHFSNSNIICHFCPKALADMDALLMHTRMVHFAEATLRYGSYETFLVYMDVKRQGQRSNVNVARPKRKRLNLICERCGEACEYRISISSNDLVRRHARQVCRCTDTVAIEYNTSTEPLIQRPESLNKQTAEVRTEAIENLEEVNCSESKRVKKTSETPFFIKLEESEPSEHGEDFERSVPRGDSVPENFAQIAGKPASFRYQPSDQNDFERSKNLNQEQSIYAARTVKTEEWNDNDVKPVLTDTGTLLLAPKAKEFITHGGRDDDGCQALLADCLENVNNPGRTWPLALESIVKTEIPDSCVDQYSDVKAEVDDVYCV